MNALMRCSTIEKTGIGFFQVELRGMLDVFERVKLNGWAGDYLVVNEGKQTIS